MERLGFVALAVLAGALFPLQAVVNARMGQSVGGPIWAAFVSFGVGTLALFAVGLLVSGTPRLGALLALPWWIWIGGLIGALLVFTMAFAAPRIGTGALLATLVAAQLVAALGLERFGVLQAVRALGPWQTVGAVLLLAGVVMIVFGPRPAGGQPSTDTRPVGSAVSGERAAGAASRPAATSQ